MKQQPCITARDILRQAIVDNRVNGHENLGFLSESHGFLPVRPPLQALPPTHQAWDEIAAGLPVLYEARSVRAAFDQLDELPAGEAALPPQFLLRASALLSIFAHAYARCDPTGPPAMPPAIRRPWETVTRRLGRRAPVLSYIDLIVYNWRLIDAQRPDPLRVENLRLLVPTVDNQEERVFYLTQLEILAGCTPLIAAVVRAQEAVAEQDRDALKQALMLISTCLAHVTHTSLPKIDPRERSHTYVDPVVWAKTVAPFAVPLQPGVPGPSGTSSPIFHLLDAFFGRRAHDSRLGAEMLHLRAWYPRHWRALLQAVEQISLADFVEHAGDRELSRLFREALRAYAGADGFLGRHRLKVAGYLELAFKVGRSVTIGGFSGLFDDRTWDEVDEALDAARRERMPEGAHGQRADRLEPAASPAGARGAVGPNVAEETGSHFAYDISEVALHNDARSGYWLILGDGVYDLSHFARKHPGGFHVLRGYAGMDASSAFRRIGHHAHASVQARMARYRIGSVRRLRFAPPEAAARAELRPSAVLQEVFYRAWIRALYLVVELENALHNEYTIRRTTAGGAAVSRAPSPHQLQLALEVHRRFVREHLQQLCSDRFAELWIETSARLVPGEDDGWMERALTEVWSGAGGRAVERHADTLAAAQDQTGAAGPEAQERLATTCDQLEREDKRVLHELKLLLRTGVQICEEQGGDTAVMGSARLLDVVRQLPRVVESYCTRLQAAC